MLRSIALWPADKKFSLPSLSNPRALRLAAPVALALLLWTSLPLPLPLPTPDSFPVLLPVNAARRRAETSLAGESAAEVDGDPPNRLPCPPKWKELLLPTDVADAVVSSADASAMFSVDASADTSADAAELLPAEAAADPSVDAAAAAAAAARSRSAVRNLLVKGLLLLGLSVGLPSGGLPLDVRWEACAPVPVSMTCPKTTMAAFRCRVSALNRIRFESMFSGPYALKEFMLSPH